MNIFLIAQLIAKLYFYSPIIVEGGSMLPTISNQEIFILNKFIYRTEFPRRGDIIVFALNSESNYLYVKRIIGLPGEKVKIIPSGVYIQSETSNLSSKNVQNKVSSLAYQKLFEPYLQNEKVHYAYGEIFTVPPGEYFVLGDNRDHSKDSRFFKDPFVAKKQILGKYEFGFKIDLEKF